MGHVMSKIFGPTDSVAATKTTVGSTWTIPPGGPFHIHEICVGKGNVVDAKQACGLIKVEISSVDGVYEFAYGNGAGGATNSNNNAHEKIQCRIPAPSGGIVTVSVEDAEVAKDVTVSLDLWSGFQRVDSYCWTDANQDTTADTELTLKEGAVSSIALKRAGKIRQIRIAGSGVVDAKAGSGKLIIDVPGNGYPQEFAFGNGPGGATLGTGTDADVYGDLDRPESLNIGLNGGANIPVNTAIVAKVTTAEVMLSVMCSIQVG